MYSFFFLIDGLTFKALLQFLSSHQGTTDTHDSYPQLGPTTQVPSARASLSSYFPPFGWQGKSKKARNGLVKWVRRNKLFLVLYTLLKTCMYGECLKKLSDIPYCLMLRILIISSRP